MTASRYVRIENRYSWPYPTYVPYLTDLTALPDLTYVDGAVGDRIVISSSRVPGDAERYVVGLSTICSDPALFFSHRRDGGVTGRQAGVVRRA